MDVLGIDIAKAKFDVAVLVGERVGHGAFSNMGETVFHPTRPASSGCWSGWRATGPTRPAPCTPAWAKPRFARGGDRQLGARSIAQRSVPQGGIAEGRCRGAFLHGRGVRVSVVNPARVKAHGGSELARNKTDKLDAALIARFCRAHTPTAWTPPAGGLRELRELVRRCDASKAARVQEMNRRAAGFASPAVAASITAHLDWLDEQIEAVFAEARRLIEADPVLSKNFALSLSRSVREAAIGGADRGRGITGFGEVSAAILLADERPSAFIPTSPSSPHRPSADPSAKQPAAKRPEGPWPPSPVSRRRSTVPDRPCADPARSAASGETRFRPGSRRLRGCLYMCALSAKRTNEALAGFVRRMTAAGKSPKVILVAVARKLLVYAIAQRSVPQGGTAKAVPRAVVRTQKPFTFSPDALEPA